MTRGPLLDPKRWRRWWLPWPLACGLAVAGTLAAGADGVPVGPGAPFVQYFSPRDYHGGTQCLSVTQDARGVMYIGSLGLILEYDGSAWRKIDVDSNWASALACDPRTDTVFVGAQNNLGYLEAQPGGARTFVSLLDRLPADARDVGAISGVHATPDGVFFVGTHGVMRWRDGQFRTWGLPTASSLESAWAAGALYVSSPEIGLLRLEGDALVPASDDTLFRRARVRGMVAEPDGTLLIATRNDGLFTLRDRAVRPLACECGEFLKQAGIYGVLRLHDGSLAVATDSAGMMVLDAAHRFRSRIDERSGLRGKTIFSQFEDAEGGLWMGLQSGVARAEVNSPLTVLRAGPDDDMSSAYCVGRWFGTTVLGSQSGLYRVTAADPARAVGPRLEWLPGSPSSATALCTVENGLLTISEGKVFLLDADARIVPAAEGIGGAQDMVASRVHPGRVYVIDETGRLHALRLDAATGRWVGDGVVADLGAKGGVFSLAESARGDLWAGTTEHGAFRVELAADGPARVTSFFDLPGPLRGCRDAMGCSGGGPVRFRTTHRVCGLDASGQALRALTEFGARFCDGSCNLGEVTSYDDGSLWLTATDMRDPTGESLRGRALAGSNGRAPTFQPLPHGIEEAIGRPTVFQPVDLPPAPLTTLLLVGTTGNGVVRMDVRRWDDLPPPRPFATLVRRAVATGGNPAASGPILGDPLPYARNSAHFEFAAATMAYGAAPRFQTRLANFGAGGWSDFSERDSIDYLNLPEGRYVFEVRACNADGQLGRVASVPFRVLPPWQRTPWAYLFYALALAAALAAFIRWRGRRFRHRNIALAAVVDARTAELRQREAELVRARDDAESANRAKSAFLANMSHELRTPLNAVLGYTQLLLKQPDLSARSRERITVIGQSGGHLLALVNEVLDLSRIEAGKLAFNRSACRLGPLLDEVGATFRPRLAEKGLRFTETRAPDLPAVVYTDDRRLRQVLFNLLGNAVKFTHRGRVGLDVRPAGHGRVRFEVADTGVGIAPGELHDIFLAFHQADGTRWASQGTGLGLAISQRLVEGLGGHIEVESTPGVGSRFWFELPPGAGEPAAGAEVHAPPAAAAPGPVTGYEGAPRRLLLVDDLEDNLRVLRDFLQPLGFEIEEAADRAGCLAACARTRPDTVLLDMRLGESDGCEVTRALRALAAGATPGAIIATSASVFESDRQRALEAGCAEFLSKPLEEAQLLGALGRTLGLRWTRAVPADPGPPDDADDRAGASATAGGALPTEEARALRELSLRGDVAGIRKRLDAMRAADGPAARVALVRRLETLAAAYDMEGIHDLLPATPGHAEN